MNDIKANDFEIQAGCGFQLGIDRHEVVLPADLQTMTRIEKQSDVCADQRVSKLL